MTENLLKEIEAAITAIGRELAIIRNDQEKGFYDCAVFDLENLTFYVKEYAEDLMEKYTAEVKARPGFQLAYDIQALYMDLDPYGAGSAMDCDETEEHFTFRCAATMSDDLESMEETLQDIEDMTDGEEKYAAQVAGYRARLEALKRA